MTSHVDMDTHFMPYVSLEAPSKEAMCTSPQCTLVWYGTHVSDSVNVTVLTVAPSIQAKLDCFAMIVSNILEERPHQGLPQRTTGTPSGSCRGCMLYVVDQESWRQQDCGASELLRVMDRGLCQARQEGN